MFAKKCLLLFLVFILSACEKVPGIGAEIKSTVLPLTEESPFQTPSTVPSPTKEPNLTLISSISPDGKYSVKLDISESPVVLTILNISSQRETQIPITYRHYEEILGNGPIGFKWSIRDEIIMFVLWKDIYSASTEEDFSCFVAVNLELASPITINYSSVLRGLNFNADLGDAILEHGGKNDIYDDYFPGTNCYKDYFYGECSTSFISPSGKWELSLWKVASVTLTDLSGISWEFNYPKEIDMTDYPVTFVQRWSEDEKYVFFSPSTWYGTSFALGLFRMNLDNGEVISLLDNNLNQSSHFLSLSPQARKMIYFPETDRIVIRDLGNNSEKKIPFIVDTKESIANFIWSPDEMKVFFAKELLSDERKIISLNYYILDTETGMLILFLKNEPEYLNVTKITNTQIQIGGNFYSLLDGEIVENLAP